MSSRHRSGKGPSQRQLRVGELVRHTLSDIFARGDIQDPDLKGVILTVSEVRISPDLRQASVFVSPLGGGDAAPVLRGLARCRKYLRGELGRRMEIRFTPDLHFIEDRSFDEAERVDRLLRSGRVAEDVAVRHDGADE